MTTKPNDSVTSTWPLGQKIGFVFYSVLIGPVLGFILLMVLMNPLDPKLFHLREFHIFWFALFGYLLGGLQALLTALLICRFNARHGNIRLWMLLVCAVVGWLFGNLVHYDFLLMDREIKSVLDFDFAFLVFSPLVFGILMTLLLWYLRPRKWVGP